MFCFYLPKIKLRYDKEMGKKGNWFSVVKKALSPESKEKKDQDQKTSKSKKKWFGKQKHLDPTSSVDTVTGPPHLAPPEEVKFIGTENEQSKPSYSVVPATAVAAEAAVVAAAQTPAEVVQLTPVTRYPGKSKEEVAAIKIQAAFRGHLAVRALRALRGLVRLKSLIQGQEVKRQSTTTLRCMQTLARVQSQIRSRRVRMLEESQRQLQQKCEELETLRASMGEDWDDSLQSKEQIEANLSAKQEAAIRRERALAYAFSHQQMRKNSSRSANPMFMDQNNPHWGWSWLERWMAARPWESRSMTEKELNSDHASVKSASRGISGGEISKAYARRDLNADKPSLTAPKSSRPSSHLSPSTPPSKMASSLSVAGKLKAASPRGSTWGQDNDLRSMLSMQSERYRRHSIAGSSLRDDESLVSLPVVPSYMAQTKSARAKSRLQSPLGVENNGTPDKGSSGSAKKRLSFSASPTGVRRHSGPPKVDSSSINNTGVQTEHNKEIGVHREQHRVSNGVNW
ncbi:hypothetical protein HHK36_016563 [Tetracentron sinense]|uniref:DUF4005 domain-containing protein n=1 Tax=Tetracentron sinense TaxID=13715 RepID=A0A834Z3M5_TETSI|nr:hypothetical protein HHK36_016563 [Tetracentron sinense]